VSGESFILGNSNCIFETDTETELPSRIPLIGSQFEIVRRL
jgi:hypothetical protein